MMRLTLRHKGRECGAEELRVTAGYLMHTSQKGEKRNSSLLLGMLKALYSTTLVKIN
jgi:hypothetical protein